MTTASKDIFDALVKLAAQGTSFFGAAPAAAPVKPAKKPRTVVQSAVTRGKAVARKVGQGGKKLMSGTPLAAGGKALGVLGATAATSAYIGGRGKEPMKNDLHVGYQRTKLSSESPSMYLEQIKVAAVNTLLAHGADVTSAVALVDTELNKLAESAQKKTMSAKERFAFATGIGAGASIGAAMGGKKGLAQGKALLNNPVMADTLRHMSNDDIAKVLQASKKGGAAVGAVKGIIGTAAVGAGIHAYRNRKKD
jgi:hypothetical protein